MTIIGPDRGGSGALSGRAIVSTPFPAQPDGVSEGRRWEECGSDVGWTDDSSLKATEHDSRLTMDEERDTLSYGGDFTTRKHHRLSHSSGPRIREASATPFHPRQHTRTRSLSGFHREASVDM